MKKVDWLKESYNIKSVIADESGHTLGTKHPGSEYVGDDYEFGELERKQWHGTNEPFDRNDLMNIMNSREVRGMPDIGSLGDLNKMVEAFEEVGEMIGNIDIGGGSKGGGSGSSGGGVKKRKYKNVRFL